MDNLILDIIHASIIKRAKKENGVASIALSDGTSTAFYFGRFETNIPSKLKQTDPCFYQKICDEIFDEVHPY